MTEQEAPETLIEAKLWKDILPTYGIQVILGSSRVVISKGTVSTTTLWHFIYSALWAALVTYSCGYFYVLYLNDFYNQDFPLFFMITLDTILQNTICALTLFTNRFTYREENIKIISMIQNVDKMLGLENNTDLHEFFFRTNCFVVILITGCFSVGYTAHVFSLFDNPLPTIFFACGLLNLYIDVISGFGFIYILAVRVRYMNWVIKKRIKEYRGRVEKKHVKPFFSRKRFFLMLVPDVKKIELELDHDLWLKCLLHVLRCYKTVTRLFSMSVLCISLIVLIWTLFTIGLIVEGYIITGCYPFYATVTIGVWGIYYYLMLMIISIINHWFINEVCTMKLLCIRLTSYDCNGPFVKTTGKIIRRIHYEKPVFEVYGLFVFDRMLPLVIIQVIASNAFILIQFLV